MFWNFIGRSDRKVACRAGEQRDQVTILDIAIVTMMWILEPILRSLCMQRLASQPVADVLTMLYSGTFLYTQLIIFLYQLSAGSCFAWVLPPGVEFRQHKDIQILGSLFFATPKRAE